MSDYLSGIENIFEKRSCRRTAVALIIAYWTVYELTGNEQFLNKAFFRAQVSGQDDFAGVELLFCRIFISINRNEYSDAYELISKLTPHKNYFKNTNPFYYEMFTFMNTLIEIRIKNQRAANKYFRMLEDALEEDNGYALPLMMGILKFESGEYSKAAVYFSDCHLKGCDSAVFFVYLHKLFHEINQANADNSLFGAYVRWASARGIKLTRVINYNKHQVQALVSREPWSHSVLYAACQDEWLLIELCKSCINRSDYSEAASQYLHEAETRQLTQFDIKELSAHLVKCAYVNRSLEISRYMMEVFVISLKTMKLEDDFKAFVFHILLNNKKYTELASNMYDEMLKFAIHCLENDLTGNHYNSVYKVFLEITYTSSAILKKVPDVLIVKAEKFIFADLFAYEIAPSNPAVRQVWIIEKEKKELTCCSIANGKAVIKSSVDHFSYVCFGTNSKQVLDSSLTISKKVENTDVGLCLYFCKKNRVNVNLMIYLARHYIMIERRSELGEKILKQLLAGDKISEAFRCQINAALGSYRHQMNDAAGAAAYYSGTDIGSINDKHIEKMLTVFMSAKMYDKACSLIIKKASAVSDKTLFATLKQLSATEEYRPYIAETAYKLVLRSWYDKVLLGTILKNYNAGQEEWQELSRALSNISVSDPELDGIILKNAIWMHKLDIGTQKIFARIPENESLVAEFAYYCVYEIILNSQQLEYDTISILEKMFYKTRERIYAYGLTCLYLNHGISTLKSDDIIDRTISFAEEDHLIFPVFKTSKDKRISSPYIEQNQPFIYKCAPGKDIVLYYKADDDKDFRYQKMSYFRFGLYYTSLPHFFGEKLRYYFSEEMPTGSITTKEETIENNTVRIIEHVSREDRMYERFFNINNALVYEQMFRYDLVEKIITDSLRDLRKVKGEIM